MDMDEHMEVIIPMIKGMMEGFAGLDSTATPEQIEKASSKMEEEMARMSMDCTIESQIELDPKSSWLKSIRCETSLVMNMGPIRNERKDTVNTVSFTRKK